jgi:hypothetical protein
MEILKYANDESYRTDPAEARSVSDMKLESLKHSLSMKGFARDVKPYEPPNNVENLIEQIFKEVGGKQSTENLLSISLANHILKFKFLSLCASHFDHEVSNSDLHRLKVVGDVVSYYSTAVRGVNSYDHLIRNQDMLPANLHVIQDPELFNPEEKDKFHKGIDAFPGLIDQTRGLRARAKYPSVKKVFHWPDI